MMWWNFSVSLLIFGIILCIAQADDSAEPIPSLIAVPAIALRPTKPPPVKRPDNSAEGIPSLISVRVPSVPVPPESVAVPEGISKPENPAGTEGPPKRKYPPVPENSPKPEDVAVPEVKPKPENSNIPETESNPDEDVTVPELKPDNSVVVPDIDASVPEPISQAKPEPEPSSTTSVGDKCDGRVEKWCDFKNGLICHGQKCECFGDHMHFDERRKKCLSKVWFPCGELSTFDVKKPVVECVENATCRKRRSTTECRCNKDFRESEAGFCIPISVDEDEA